MTDAERRLWFALRDRRLSGYKFRRQHPIDGAILDFACIAHRLAIEADGGQHDPASDAARTRRINAAGWRIARFWNNEILDNTEGVVLTILAELQQHPAHTNDTAVVFPPQTSTATRSFAAGT